MTDFSIFSSRLFKNPEQPDHLESKEILVATETDWLFGKQHTYYISDVTRFEDNLGIHHTERHTEFSEKTRQEALIILAHFESVRHGSRLDNNDGEPPSEHPHYTKIGLHI